MLIPTSKIAKTYHADPEARIYNNKYYIYATKSRAYSQQDNIDLYVSDDGKNYEFEILDAIETDDGRYLAMIPYFANAKDKLDDSGELVLVKVFEDEDGEEYFEDIPDDDEYETVADLFINRLQDLFDIDEQ